MNYKSIQNNDQVTLSNCEDEPIHIPGSIQPHGFLLAIDKGTLEVKFCSSNIVDYTGLSHEQVLTKNINKIFSEEQYRLLSAYLQADAARFHTPLKLVLADRKFNCSIHISGDVQVLELEPAGEDSMGLMDVYQQTRQFTQFMETAGSLKMLAQMVADEVRNIIGFDRVMVYRFDKEYNGHVIAESKAENIEPFLDLHYPHTDIPAQARALYLKNLLRIIVDVTYAPVPIFTTQDNTQKDLDLTHSVLRSVSPIHVQYLKNMGVDASMSISLIHEQRLWGLIACHHYSPRFVPGDLRIAAQLQGHFLTSQITVREQAEEYLISKDVDKALNIMLDSLSATENLSFAELVENDEILQMTNATGLILFVDNTLYMSGDLPSENELGKLLNWLNIYSPTTSFSTSNFQQLYPDSAAYCELISGIIFHPLGSGNCIVWCRKEVLQEVKWAGKPDEKLSPGSVKSLSPRKSFEIWSETKRCYAEFWEKPEMQAAANFAHALQRQVNMSFLRREEEKQRRLNVKLQEANSELENLYWIGSHDLKEPLRKIQVFASRIIDEDSSPNFDDVVNSVKRMNDSAKRMQLLISDILAYSKLNKPEGNLQLMDLNQVVQTVLNELSGEIIEKTAHVTTDQLPSVKGIPSFLQQLFVNLLRNSLKFSRSGESPVIEIKNDGINSLGEPEDQDKYYIISIHDNGIGFDPRFNESIFKVFTRLHAQSEYTGSGVGLALCRKIMTTHHGHIRAKGSPGQGACIELYFPVDNRV